MRIECGLVLPFTVLVTVYGFLQTPLKRGRIRTVLTCRLLVVTITIDWVHSAKLVDLVQGWRDNGPRFFQGLVASLHRGFFASAIIRSLLVGLLCGVVKTDGS